MRIAFAAHGIREQELTRVEFYRQDIEILRSLGHDVYWAPNALRLRPGTDLIYCWWWTYAWRAVVSGMLRRIPVVVTGVFDLPTFVERPWYQRVAMSAGAKLASANVFVSKHERDGVQGLLGLRAAEHSPLAVDRSTYAERPPDRAGPSRFTIANVAWKRKANMRRKMLPELVESMRFVRTAIPDARLILAGPAEDGEAVLRDIVASLGLDGSVEFRGEISVREKVALYYDCDVYVQCSRYEGFGLAVAEAMACGACVIVTPVPPLREVVGECGVYVDPATPEAIGKAIVDLARSPELRAAIAACGARRVAEHFSIDRRRQDLDRVLTRLMAD